MSLRLQVWNKLAAEWTGEELWEIAQFCSLEELNPYIDQILAGKIVGRVVVRHD